MNESDRGAMSEGEQVERQEVRDLVARLHGQSDNIKGWPRATALDAIAMLESIYAENERLKQRDNYAGFERMASTVATLTAERDAALLRVQHLEAYALSVYMHESDCALAGDKDCDCMLSTIADQTFAAKDQL